MTLVGGSGGRGVRREGRGERGGRREEGEEEGVGWEVCRERRRRGRRV